MAEALRHPEGLLIRMEPAEMARLAAMASQLGLNGITDDSVGSVLGRPVRIALLAGSLLERQFWLLLFFLAPGWELTTIAASLGELQSALAALTSAPPDLVIADPTGLCSRCPVSCQGDLDSCPLLSQRQLIENLPPLLLHLRQGDLALACRALAAGVRGLQLHRRGLMGLRDAVLAMMGGSLWIDPDLSNDLRQLLGAAAPAGDQGHGSPQTLLSQRERQVLLALESGCTVAGVAERLMLSENTVKTHLRRIYDKLGVDNRRDALLRARLSGELDPICASG